VIGTGVNDVFRGISGQLGGVAANALFPVFGSGFLDDIVGAQVTLNQQRIDRFASAPSLALTTTVWGSAAVMVSMYPY